MDEYREQIEPGALYVVATPIGNLADVSERAAAVLTGVDLIVAEDTRHSGRLLARLGVSTPQRAYHDHNERKVAPELVARLKGGDSIAMISDAGTPAVSDPGYRLLALAVEEGVRIIPIPGPSAALAALVASGLPTDRFAFEGFLPKKKGRQTRLTELAQDPRTLIFFESPQRLARTLADLAGQFGPERRVAVGRELTKRHEEISHGRLGELAERFAGEVVKGEITIVVEGATRRAERSEPGDAGTGLPPMPPLPGQ